MFSVPINKSPLFGAAADEIFANLKADAYRGDVSFISALRMLLYSRFPKEKTAEVSLRNINLTELSGLDMGSTEMMKVLTRNPNYTNEIEDRVWVVEVTCDGGKDAHKNGMALFEKVTNLDGMGAEPAMDKMFQQFSACRTFIDFEKSRTMILVFDRMAISKWHAFAAFTSRYFKRYFKESPVTPDETKRIVEGLMKEKSADLFKTAEIDFAKQFDFRSPMIKASLRGFENRHANVQVESLNRSIEQKAREIDEANDRYASLVRSKIQLEEKRTAMMLSIKECEDELMNYFLSNKNLLLESVQDNCITFYAKTPFANFNPDLAERMIKNRDRGDRVDIYVRGPGNVKKEDRDILFKAMFLDRTVRVWLYGKFNLSVQDGNCISAHSGFDQPTEMADTCPNPHLHRHGCMGDNKRAAIEAVLAGDYVGAVEQCIGSVASVNLAEGMTSGPWMDLLLSDNYGRFFETEAGMMNFSEVMKYLKEDGKKGVKKSA